jgi:hypothetical protein
MLIASYVIGIEMLVYDSFAYEGFTISSWT